MDKVSIVVPVYNAENYIIDCIESLQNQTYENIEIILVNDGSTDNSKTICEDCGKKDKRIKVVTQINSGVSVARNTGIDTATGDYIIFVDSDDVIKKETVEENLNMAKATGADMIVYCFRYDIVDEKRIKDNGLAKDFTGTAEEFFVEHFNTMVEKELLNPPWNKFIRREILVKNKIRFNLQYSICEDMAFSTEVLSACSKVAINHKMYYDYILKLNGTLVFKFHENYFEALSYFYEKAIEYCGKFNKNEKQVKCIDSLYARLTIMYLKQISCNSNWEMKKCYQKIQEIIRNEKFIKALQNAELTKKKAVVKLLIKYNCYRMICNMYKLGAKL